MKANSKKKFIKDSIILFDLLPCIRKRPQNRNTPPPHFRDPETLRSRNALTPQRPNPSTP